MNDLNETKIRLQDSILQTNVLQADNIYKSFLDGDNRVDVLKGVSIHIPTKQMAAIIGASGSGKSTLLHILGGLDSPDSGEVLVAGENIHKVSARKQGDIRNQHLGFVYQFHHLLMEFSALENVAMPLIIGDCGKGEAFERAAAMVDKVGLGSRQSHKPAQLSGGERQRIALARSMVTKPACILADEPTGNLDTATAQSIHELMLELNESENTSFLVVSHDLKLANSMQKVYRMTDGELQAV